MNNVTNYNYQKCFNSIIKFKSDFEVYCTDKYR